jgi:cell wall-associated NlpC family hydrolase
MRLRSFMGLLVCVVTVTGCTLLKLHPEPEVEDDIRISWEEGTSDHLVVSYKSDTRGTNDGKQDQVTKRSVILDTTISNDHAALFAEIETWMGTPYGYGRHEKGKGTDCSGFTMEVYAAVYGIALFRSSDGQVGNTVEVKKGDLQIGDLVFFKIRPSRISHVGIYIGNNKFVHATTRSGVIISDLNEKYYLNTYARSGRVIRQDGKK